MSNQITTATNLQSVNLNTASLGIATTNTNRYFNNFFAGDFSIGPANDAIVAYFQEYTGNAQSGTALASAVIYTAQAQGLDPMAVLDQFRKAPANELNNYLAAYLNFSRAPTSTLGVKSPQSTTNPYVARTILP